MRAMEQNAMAEVISKVLYPADNHREGKIAAAAPAVFPGVRLGAGYRATAIWRTYGTLDNLPDKVADPHQRHPSHAGDPRS